MVVFLFVGRSQEFASMLRAWINYDIRVARKTYEKKVRSIFIFLFLLKLHAQKNIIDREEGR